MRERIAIGLLLTALACNSSTSQDASGPAAEPTPEVEPPAEEAPDSAEAQNPAEVHSPTEPVVIPLDTPLVEPGIPVHRGERIQPKVGVLPPIRGQAAALFDTILAQVEVPEGLEFKQLREQAWDDFLSGRSQRALDGFMLMSKVQPEEWRWPLAAARACVDRNDGELAEVFLVASILRGGDEARAKARSHGSLRDSVRRPWLDELLAADEAALRRWEIHSRQVLAIEAVPADEASFEISRLYVDQTAPRAARHSDDYIERFPVGRLSLSFDAKVVPGGGLGAVVLATCKVGERYVQDYVRLYSDDFGEPVGDQRHVYVELMDQPWVEPYSFEVCELDFFQGEMPDETEPEAKRVAQWCWRDRALTEGPCLDFQPPLREELHVNVVSLQPEVYGDYGGVFVEFEPGRAPGRDVDLFARVVCEREGALPWRATLELYAIWKPFARPGRALRVLDLVSFNGVVPKRCELEIGRDNEGYQRVGAGAFFCYEDGVTRAGPCEAR